jgi:hypothetical protein
MGCKYAVLISAEESGYTDFWTDLVLMRDALLVHRFMKENIFVLYGLGQDYFDPNNNPKYNPPGGPLTKYPADKVSVTKIFSDLATGTGDTPKLTDEDLLFVWTFDHGDRVGDHSAIVLEPDDRMLDIEFASLVDKVHYGLRMICMQQCYSGGFVPLLKGDRSLVLTACEADQVALPCDTEMDTFNGVKYPHGEFDVHLLEVLTGKTWDGKPVDLDLDHNKVVTIEEIFEYIQRHDNQPEENRTFCGSKVMSGLIETLRIMTSGIPEKDEPR